MVIAKIVKANNKKSLIINMTISIYPYYLLLELCQPKSSPQLPFGWNNLNIYKSAHNFHAQLAFPSYVPPYITR